MTTASVPSLSWAKLPLELVVAEIPNQLPIVCRPAALISLALTCRSLHDLIIPRTLYRVVWLEGEQRALYFLSRFNAQLSKGPQLSRHIHYLCIVSELSENVRNGPTNVLQELRVLISAGGLRNLIAFTLHLEAGWGALGELNRSFWDALAKNCSMITRVHLTGIADPQHWQGWIADSGVFEIKVSMSNWEHAEVGLNCTCNG